VTLTNTGSFTITATKTSGTPTGTSNSFTVAAGTATQLFFTTQPAATTVAGATITPAVVVEVRDAAGNAVTTDPSGGTTEQVTLAFTSGTNTEGATLGGTLTANVDWTTGRATFNTLSVNLIGNYSLDATGVNFAPALTPATSSTFDITATVPVATAATLVVLDGFNANWTATTNATSYRIDVSTATNFSSFVGSYNDLTVSGGGTATLAVTGLTPNTTYFYRVRAVSAGGTSANSNTITVLTAPGAADGSGTANIAPTTVGAAATTTQMLTYTAAAGGMATGAQVTMVVPANWSAPQTSSSATAGFTRANIAGGGPSITNVAVTGSGPWTVTVTLPATLHATETVVIVYGDAGNPGGAAATPSGAQTGSYLFQVQEKSTTGGTLTNVAGTQTVTVVSADGSGTADIAPTTVTAASTTTETLTYTAVAGGIAAGGQVTMVVPANWSAPQTTSSSAAGFTGANIAGGGLSITNVAVSGSGPWTVTVTLPTTLNSGQTVLIVYGDASGNPGGAAVVPGTTDAGAYTFTVQQKSTSGGTPTTVSGTQTVTVDADGSGLANVAATSLATAMPTTVTLTYTVPTGGISASAQVTMAVPAAWTAPQTTNGTLPGFTEANINGGGLSVSNVSVSGGGPWTITVTVPSGLTAGQTILIVYGSTSANPGGAVTAPAAGTYLFQAQQKATSGGTLKNVTGTQTIVITP
jgi:hypothetical protein